MNCPRTLITGLAATSLAVLLAAGCGGSSKKASTTAPAVTSTTTAPAVAIQPPANIKSAGKLVFCSDITYPPEESYKKGTTTPEGSDIDIGNDIAKRMGVTARFDNKDFLDEQSKKLQSEGKKPIKVVTFPKDTDAANALKTGKVDAYFGDSPPVAYYVETDPTSFEVGGNPINPISIGIAIRKSDTQLQTAVLAAVAAMYSDGTMKRIVAKWNLSRVVADVSVVSVKL